MTDDTDKHVEWLRMEAYYQFHDHRERADNAAAHMLSLKERIAELESDSVHTKSRLSLDSLTAEQQWQERAEKAERDRDEARECVGWKQEDNDRLRKERDAWKEDFKREAEDKMRIAEEAAAECGRLRKERDEAQVDKGLLVLERDWLRKAIEDAPHGAECDVQMVRAGHRLPMDVECDCWKREALDNG